MYDLPCGPGTWGRHKNAAPPPERYSLQGPDAETVVDSTYTHLRWLFHTLIYVLSSLLAVFE